MAGTGERLVYIVDASSWIAIDDDPATNRILAALVPLIDDGRIRIPPLVWEELKEKSRVIGWLEQHREKIVERRIGEPTFLSLVGEISHDFPGMAGARGTKEKADPWVVAMAVHAHADPRTRVVVCNETADRRRNRKIPGACAHYKVMCMTLLEMLDREHPDDGWLS
jgi:hypothetical protein